MNKRFRAHKCIDQRWNIVTLHRTTKDSLPLSELIHLFVDHFKASKVGIFVVSHSTRLSLLLTFGSLCWYFPIQISERNIIQRCATIFHSCISLEIYVIPNYSKYYQLCLLIINVFFVVYLSVKKIWFVFCNQSLFTLLNWQMSKRK